MNEAEYIIERMSGPELELLAGMGMILPPRLRSRLEAWRQQQRQRDERREREKREVRLGKEAA